jgi:hypothetical protein
LLGFDFGFSQKPRANNQKPLFPIRIYPRNQRYGFVFDFGLAGWFLLLGLLFWPIANC